MGVAAGFDGDHDGLGVFRGLPDGYAAGFTTRELTPDDLPVDVGARRLAESLRAPEADVVRLRQVHGRSVLLVDDEPDGQRVRVAGEADGLVTSRPNRIVLVASADCVPVLLVEPVAGLVAAVHAGWRGTAQRILDVALDLLEARGGAALNLFVCLGPSISRDRYEVGPEVAGALRAAYDGLPVPEEAITRGAGDRSFVDVAAFNRALLTARGVREVIDAGLCTATRSDLPSYRRDGPGTGRILTGVVRLS